MKQLFSLLLSLSLCLGLSAQDDFFATDKIQDIRITFEADNWQYQLDSLRYNGTELLAAELNINGTELSDAGVRFRGDRSFTPRAKRNGLIIQLGDQDYQGYQTLDLSSALRDPSMIRDVLAREIAGSYTPTPAANFAKVYINDTFYGLLVNIEPIEGPFLQRHYGEDSGHVVFANPDIGNTPPEGCSSTNYGALRFEKSTACQEHNFDAIQGDLNGIADLAFSLNGDTPTPDRYLDVDAALWMLALNNALVNLSSYSGQYANNYYLYRAADDKFKLLLGDLNLAFGSYKNDGQNASDLSTVQLIQLPTDLHRRNENRPLLNSLLADANYQMMYRAHLRTILAEWILSGKLENRARALQAMINTAVNMDANKYYSVAEFSKSLNETIGTRSKIPGILSFMDKRGSWLQSQTVYTFLPPAISAVGVSGRAQFSSEQLQEFRVHATVEGYPKHVYVYYRLGNSGEFVRQEMLDDGAHFDGEKNNGQFGTVIPAGAGQQTIEYYILAENAKAMGYSPSQYNFERYSSSLDKVNQ